jgi:hypothetical protein
MSARSSGVGGLPGWLKEDWLCWGCSDCGEVCLGEPLAAVVLFVPLRDMLSGVAEGVGEAARCDSLKNGKERGFLFGRRVHVPDLEAVP